MTPTTRDWASAAVAYLSAAYRLETGESLALVDDLVGLLDDLDLTGDPSQVRTPVGVLDQAAGRVTMPGDQPAVGTSPALRVPAASWADFLVQFVGASKPLPAERMTALWSDLVVLLERYELPQRDVVFVSGAVHDGLAIAGDNDDSVAGGR